MTDTANTVEQLLKNKPHIVTEVDKDGRSALHYAAFVYDVSSFLKILDADSSVGYLRDKDGMTALHYAAEDYHDEVSSDFLSIRTKKMNGKLRECCPDCWEMKDNKGRNFLHIASENRRVDFFKDIFEDMPPSQINDLMVMNLLNKRENNGKTPCDLLFGEVPDEFIPDRDECRRIIMLDPRARHHIYSGHYNLDVSPKNRTLKAEEKIENEVDRQDIEGQANMVVATLLATIAFAAAFTVPGGYTSEGTATLARTTAFAIFTVCNSLTMLLSCSSLIAYFSFVALRAELGPSRIKTESSFHTIPSVCTLLAIPTTMGAFVAGTYAVLSELPGLAIPICILSCSFFPFFFIIFYRTTCKFITHYKRVGEI